MDFIAKSIKLGYRDIVVVAPTGGGKSAIGMALASWSFTPEAEMLGKKGAQAGAYYLVTQKMLQDQLEADTPTYVSTSYAKRAVVIKAADNYACHSIIGSCADKSAASKPCSDCIYKAQKSAFISSPVGITNYAYFFTERQHVGSLGPRRLLICDEAHNLESEVIRLAEIELSEDHLLDFAPELEQLAKHRDAESFVTWLKDKYLPQVDEKIKALSATASIDAEVAKELRRVAGHYTKIQSAADSFLKENVEWVYWEGERKRPDDPRVQFLRPLKAAHFFKKAVQQVEGTRLYLSAFLGNKKTFCATLGLDPDKVAWCSLKSEFPVENRKVRIIPVGSMNFASKKTTTPKLLSMCERILNKHPNEKGVIHCGSYDLGQQTFDYLNRKFPGRILFPKNAEDRDAIFQRHKDFSDPTVIISPSMTEGYDLKDDLARFQIMQKCPFLYMKDAQVAARMKIEPKWYALRTAMTTVQSVGRGVRTPTDYCVSYLLDSDFEANIDRHEELYPEWFLESVKIVKPSKKS